MAFLENTSILSLFCILMSIVTLCICILQKQRSVIPTNWPLLGMIPGVLQNAHRIPDYMVDISIHSDGTFMWKGPWFTRLSMLFTTNPLDIHHILSKNFGNYPKGDKFHKIIDILGDGILNSEGELWEMNRKVTMSIFKHPGFQNMLEKIIWDKVENGLLPVLDSICGHGHVEIDLQDIFQRFTFDTICNVLFDHDPQTLSPNLPYNPRQHALSLFEEVVFFRHLTPPFLWKLQQFLGIGKEKYFSEVREILDEFIYRCIFAKQDHELQDEKKFVVLTKLMNGYIKDQSFTTNDPIKHFRDILLDLMVAGKDTTSSALSWFFFNLAKNPKVIDKILEEVYKHLDDDVSKMSKRWSAKELSKMVYLHGALCESLRLFPPVPYNHKSPTRPDTLPSGHKVDQSTRIILPLYTMGRTKSIWGEDCMEFNPERWISKTGGTKHEPSYKFVTFGAGPRSCVGKDMALCQLKIVAATIICRYHIELVKGHPVVPANAIILHMKHGLKVRLTKRSELN